MTIAGGCLDRRSGAKLDCKGDWDTETPPFFLLFVRFVQFLPSSFNLWNSVLINQNSTFFFTKQENRNFSTLIFTKKQ
jgi:hypothetical protein